jgi:fluoroquinolone transport system permease protein
MRKYIEIFKFEMKNIVRDRMTLTMLIFPVIMLFFSAFLVPALLKRAEGNETAMMYASIISFITFISIGTFLIGSLMSFVLLDRKDEKTLHTIAATPLSVKGYVNFMAVYHYIITVIMNLIVLIGTKAIAGGAYSYTIGGITVNLFAGLSYGKIIAYSFVSALYMPALGLFLSGLSGNKIEGFAYMKFSGFLIFIPILIIFKAFSGGGQYILGIAPNFWSIKGLLASVMPDNKADINFWLYMLFGALYSAVLCVLSYKFFLKRSRMI